MALQIRRGVEGSGTGGRLTITPVAGELLYTTDTKKLYIGDGTTAGGVAVNTILEDELTPKLNHDLDTNGQNILTSITDGNIAITTTGAGRLYLNSSNEVQIGGTYGNGNVRIIKDGYSSAFGEGLYFQQYHNTPDSVNLNYTRARGTFAGPTIIQNGDDIVDLSFAGYDGVKYTSGAAISATVEGAPILNNVPTKLSLITNNGSSTAVRAELSATGVWKVNTIQSLTANTALSFGGMAKLANYATQTVAETAVGGTPTNGMMYYDMGANMAKIYGNGSWHALW
jgi:hypothetical protein